MVYHVKLLLGLESKPHTYSGDWESDKTQRKRIKTYTNASQTLYDECVSAGMHFGGPQMGFENVHIGAK